MTRPLSLLTGILASQGCLLMPRAVFLVGWQSHPRSPIDCMIGFSRKREGLVIVTNSATKFKELGQRSILQTDADTVNAVSCWCNGLVA
jgi:hypothetical protein